MQMAAAKNSRANRTNPSDRDKDGKASRANGVQLRVIDLFCGVGGLSLGAARAGFTVTAAVDNDRRAGEAHKANFPHCVHLSDDVARLSAKTLRDAAGLNDSTVIHGVVGGPPCQGFSRIGRRSPEDPRNSLFEHFFRLVAELRPWFYVAENVLGVLDEQFAEVRRNAFSHVADYHTLGPLRLKASDFGAATSRERVFFIGTLPDHVMRVSETAFHPPEDVVAVRVEVALRGLRKKIGADWQSDGQGWRHLTCRPEGRFWDKIFREVPDGVGDEEALRRLREEDTVSGCLGTRHTPAVVERFADLEEGAVDGPSRAVRLARSGFCPTLRSGTGPEHGSFQALRPIHPTEPRVITPREAARLQGFPDWFVFHRTKWHSFRLIGNSVSPVLVERVLRILKGALRPDNCLPTTSGESDGKGK